MQQRKEAAANAWWRGGAAARRPARVVWQASVLLLVFKLSACTS